MTVKCKKNPETAFATTTKHFLIHNRGNKIFLFSSFLHFPDCWIRPWFHGLLVIPSSFLFFFLCFSFIQYRMLSLYHFFLFSIRHIEHLTYSPRISPKIFLCSISQNCAIILHYYSFCWNQFLFCFNFVLLNFIRRLTKDKTKWNCVSQSWNLQLNLSTFFIFSKAKHWFPQW